MEAREKGRDLRPIARLDLRQPDPTLRGHAQPLYPAARRASPLICRDESFNF